MERRRLRFLPGLDDLEGRVVLSAAAGPQVHTQVVPADVQRLTPQQRQEQHQAAVAAKQAAHQAAVAQKKAAKQAVADQKKNERIAAEVQSRLRRVERLPILLHFAYRQRTLPQEAVAPLQQDLLAVFGRLHHPSSLTKGAFQDTLRGVLSQQTLSKVNALKLSQSFHDLLISAGAQPDVAAKFQADMEALAQLDVQQTQASAAVAASDYGLMYQLARYVGAPADGVDFGSNTKGQTSAMTSSLNNALGGYYYKSTTTYPKGWK